MCAILPPNQSLPPATSLQDGFYTAWFAGTTSVMLLAAPSIRTDIPRAGRRLEATDRFRDHLLRQPQHHLREIDREADRHQEHHIDRQCRAQRLGKTDTDEFRR